MKKVPAVLHGGFRGSRKAKCYYGVLPATSVKAVVIPKEYGLISHTKPVKIDNHLWQVNNGFYSTLEESILKEGIKNPILLWRSEGKLYCVYGTSRLGIAYKHKLNVPAIICDFDHDPLPYLEEIIDLKELKSKFTEEPSMLIFDDGYINFVNERWHHDPIQLKANNLNTDRVYDI